MPENTCELGFDCWRMVDIIWKDVAEEKELNAYCTCTVIRMVCSKTKFSDNALL